MIFDRGIFWSYSLVYFITQPSIYGVNVFFFLLVTCFPVKNTQALIDMRDNDARTVRL